MLERRGDAHLDAELVGLVRLSPADAFDRAHAGYRPYDRAKPGSEQARVRPLQLPQACERFASCAISSSTEGPDAKRSNLLAAWSSRWLLSLTPNPSTLR